MTDLEAIRARHSVREYTDEPLAADELKWLQGIVDNTVRESGLNIQLVQSNPEAFDIIARFGVISGCSTLLAFVARKRDQDEAIGYWGQHIVLEAQKMGLNTCWVGMFSRKKCKAVCPEGMAVRVVIAVGHGKTAGKPRKSKTPQDVVSIEPGAQKPEWFDVAVEAALLAPTAINRQAFTVVLASDGTVRVDVPGKGFTRLDGGIVRRNIEVAKESVAG